MSKDFILPSATKLRDALPTSFKGPFDRLMLALTDTVVAASPRILLIGVARLVPTTSSFTFFCIHPRVIGLHLLHSYQRTRID
jgi:hypothetical protein